MKIILKARGAGKTHAAAEECIKTGTILLTCTRRRAAELEISYPGLRAMSWEEYLQRYSRGRYPAMMDDADLYLQHEFSGNLRGVTVTYEVTRPVDFLGLNDISRELGVFGSAAKPVKRTRNAYIRGESREERRVRLAAEREDAKHKDGGKKNGKK